MYSIEVRAIARLIESGRMKIEEVSSNIVADVVKYCETAYGMIFEADSE